MKTLSCMKMDADATKEAIVGYRKNVNNVVQRRRKPKKPVKGKKMERMPQSDLVALGNDKYISVRKQGSCLFLNIRQYRRDEHGRLLATKRGIMLTMPEWTQLKANIKRVGKDLKQRHAKMNSSN